MSIENFFLYYYYFPFNGDKTNTKKKRKKNTELIEDKMLENFVFVFL